MKFVNNFLKNILGRFSNMFLEKFEIFGKTCGLLNIGYKVKLVKLGCCEIKMGLL